MPDQLHFYYTRSVLGRWCPETSNTDPANQTRDGRPIKFTDHRVLGEVEAAMSLKNLARRHRCTLNKPPISGPHLEDPTLARAGEMIGAGFFVFRRGTTTGRIRPAKLWPFEHPTRAAAETETQRLADRFPGQTFITVEQVAFAYVDLPKEAAEEVQHV